MRGPDNESFVYMIAIASRSADVLLLVVSMSVESAASDRPTTVRLALLPIRPRIRAVDDMDVG
jgi:hypothetical protein